MRTLGRAVATVVSLVAGLAASVRLGRGALGSPPVGSWSAASRWYDDVGPDVAVISGVRLVAIGLAAWLLVATVLQVLGAIPALAPVGAIADLISPRSLQRLGHGLAGLSLTAGLAASAPSAGLLEPPPLPAAPPAVPAWPADAVPTAGTATMRLVTEAAPADEAPTTAPTPTTPLPHPAATVLAAAGDSLWSIATEELATTGGGPPDLRQVTGYWHRLIETNRAVLVDPTNPDLIYPGQVFTLP